MTHATENIEQCDYIAFMEPGGRLAYFGPPRAKHFFVPERRPDEVTFGDLPSCGRPAARRSKVVMAEESRLPGPMRSKSRPTSSATLRPASRRRSKVAPWPSPRRRLRPTDHAPDAAELQAGWQQFRILVGRYARLISRDKLNAAFLFLQAPLVALLLTAVSSPQALRPAGCLVRKRCCSSWPVPPCGSA